MLKWRKLKEDKYNGAQYRKTAHVEEDNESLCPRENMSGVRWTGIIFAPVASGVLRKKRRVKQTALMYAHVAAHALACWRSPAFSGCGLHIMRRRHWRITLLIVAACGGIAARRAAPRRRFRMLSAAAYLSLWRVTRGWPLPSSPMNGLWQWANAAMLV